MKFFHTSNSICLALALILLQACGDSGHNDEKKPREIRDGQTQAKIFLENVVEGKPLLLVYGDSIATGVLGTTKLGQEIGDDLLLQLGTYIKAGEYKPESFQANMANQDLAAATTARDYGLRQAIAAKHSLSAQDIGVVSLARFGAEASDIPGMISDWQDQEISSIQAEPDYILVALGANDFCSNKSVETITADFQAQIEAIHQSAPGAQLIISPAPPVNQLAAIDHTYDSKISQITGEELSCRKFREQYCENLDAADAATRLAGINQGIEAAYNFQKAKGIKAYFTCTVKDWKINAEELSFDCFHPSEQGQTSLGKLLQQAIKD